MQRDKLLLNSELKEILNKLAFISLITLLHYLGAIHLGRPAYPGEGGSPKTGHLLLFLKEFYCLTRTDGGGGV